MLEKEGINKTKWSEKFTSLKMSDAYNAVYSRLSMKAHHNVAELELRHIGQDGQVIISGWIEKEHITEIVGYIDYIYWIIQENSNFLGNESPQSIIDYKSESDTFFDTYYHS